MLICEMFLKIVISIYVCVYVVIKFLINKINLDHLYKLSFPLPKDTSHDQAVSEKKIFEIVDRRTDDGRRRTDDGAWPSYKLTL